MKVEDIVDVDVEVEDIAVAKPEKAEKLIQISGGPWGARMALEYTTPVSKFVASAYILTAVPSAGEARVYVKDCSDEASRLVSEVSTWAPSTSILTL